MVVKNTRKKSTAMIIAKRARKLGFRATVSKKKKGFGVSVTRKKK